MLLRLTLEEVMDPAKRKEAVTGQHDFGASAPVAASSRGGQRPSRKPVLFAGSRSKARSHFSNKPQGEQGDSGAAASPSAIEITERGEILSTPKLELGGNFEIHVFTGRASQSVLVSVDDKVSVHFSLEPDQARAFAANLVAMADAVDRLRAEAGS